MFQAMCYTVADLSWKGSKNIGEIFWGALLFGMSGKAAACLVACMACGLFGGDLFAGNEGARNGAHNARTVPK